MKTTVNKITRGKVAEKDKIYLAGLFDGEGHIFITEDKRPNYKTSLHILRVGVTNTHQGVIEWLYSLFPTTISKRVRHKDHPTWKTCYFWESSSNKSLHFLKAVYPYLRIKKEQARLAIEFQETWQDRRTRDKRGRIQKTSKEIHQKRHWYKLSIQALNKGKQLPAETKRKDT